jgi:hypothetical protein
MDRDQRPTLKMTVITIFPTDVHVLLDRRTEEKPIKGKRQLILKNLEFELSMVVHWFMVIIPVIKEVEIGGLQFKSPTKQKCETLSEKENEVKTFKGESLRDRVLAQQV